MFISTSKMLIACLCAYLFSTILNAHQVEQFYAEQDELNGFIALQFDVAYAIPETRDDLSAPQPKREWLIQQSPEEHLILIQEATSYLHKYLRLHSEGETIDYTLEFPDFDESPHPFISLLNQGAYYRVQIRPKKGNIETIEPELLLAKSPKLLLARKIGAENTYTTYHPPLDDIGEEPTPSSRESNILVIGFKHVIPDGLDHILFIIGICLTASSVRQLLLKSLIFTITHALSMALIISTILPIYDYPISNYIEPIIALSISFIAIEVFFKTDHKYSYILVALFGLVHGCGFAGSLGSSLQSLNTANWIQPLIIANIGIELAQALLVICTFCLLLYFRKSLSKKGFTLLNHCLATSICIIGITWFFQRL